MIEPSAPSQPGASRMLGRYELVELLGQGGMGEVYLAKISGAAGFEKPCIVKTILPQLLVDPQFLDRFHHEAKVLVHLQHSNIAQVYDMGEADSTYFMALEYVPGVDLEQLIDRARADSQPIPLPVALYLAQKMAEGLAYAHRKVGPDGVPLHIVHRDISPQNVMVSYDGEVKVIDFGLAKSAGRSKHTQARTVMGKIGYMSPEQARGDSVDHRSDIYSAGVVLWELLAGRPLIPSGTVGEMMAAMISPRVPPLVTLRPDVDGSLDAVVRRTLAVDSQERYARADELARALNEQLFRPGHSVSSEEVGNYVRALCPDAFEAQRRLISKLSTLRNKSPLPEVDAGDVTKVSRTPPARREVGFDATHIHRDSPTELPVGASQVIPGQQGRRGLLIGLAVLALAGTAGATALLVSHHDAAREKADLAAIQPPAAPGPATAAPMPAPPPPAPVVAAPPVVAPAPVEKAPPPPEPKPTPTRGKLHKRRSAGGKALASADRSSPDADDVKGFVPEEPPPSISATGASAGQTCRMDNDCSGELICVQHLCAAPARQPPPAPAPPAAGKPLQGRASAGGFGPMRSVTIFNADPRKWTNCVATVRGRFKYFVGVFYPGAKREVPYSAFVFDQRARYCDANQVCLDCAEASGDFAVPP